ncbi:MAG: hypothetical protein R3325_08825 [Thermoanaerobaculia bacterium]|nr:hypothetical protein [Thermoanaerobaculia bacterium]
MIRRSKAAVLVLGWILATALSAGAALAASELRLESRLRGPREAAGPMVGKVTFRHRLDQARRKFSVEVERARAGQMFDVMVSGVVVGTLLIDDLGVGELDYDDTAGGNDRDRRFPRNFPELDGGEVVQVGPLTGTLQLR